MKNIKELSKCEKEVLNTIYGAEEAPDLRAVREMVNAKWNHEWKPQTVSTFLTRLVKKGWLSMYRKGRYCYYETLVSKEDYEKYIWNEVLLTSFNGNVEKFKQSVLDFCEED